MLAASWLQLILCRENKHRLEHSSGQIQAKKIITPLYISFKSIKQERQRCNKGPQSQTKSRNVAVHSWHLKPQETLFVFILVGGETIDLRTYQILEKSGCFIKLETFITEL